MGAQAFSATCQKSTNYASKVTFSQILKIFPKSPQNFRSIDVLHIYVVFIQLRRQQFKKNCIQVIAPCTMTVLIQNLGIHSNLHYLHYNLVHIQEEFYLFCENRVDTFLNSCSACIYGRCQLHERLFTTFSWPYFYPMSNLHFKSTMLLCLLSNKNTTHVSRSTKLNKKEKKFYVDTRVCEHIW